MFNEYIWNTYLKADGKNVVDFFERNLSDLFSEDYAHTICEFQKSYCPSNGCTEYLYSELKELCDSFNIEDFGFLYGCLSIAELQDCEYSIKNIMDIFYQGLNDSGTLSDKQIFSEFCGGLAYYTTFLAIVRPKLFIPYYSAATTMCWRESHKNLKFSYPQFLSKKTIKDDYTTTAKFARHYTILELNMV